MSPVILFSIVMLYFGLLLGVAWQTSRKGSNAGFFIGNRNSHWMLVAFGMIGTSLSGVTFISVPGAVSRDGFYYFQIILGQFFGYLVIAYVLLPLYYRLQLVSIYHYLDVRLGRRSYQAGASFFILSRTLGATARLYLVVRILQDVILSDLGLPFWFTTLLILLMIVLYTYRGGVKTLIWTDTLQTMCMLAGLLICVAYILGQLDLRPLQALDQLQTQGLARIFNTDIDSRFFFAKQIIAGVFIAIAMTGMDQEMMQKTISVTTVRDAQKNVLLLSVTMLGVVLLFLYLGGLLSLFASSMGMAATGDKLFPAVVFGYLPPMVQVLFVIALISALFPSADGAITALTSSFCIDILGISRNGALDEAGKTRIRHRVHLGFALLFLVLIMGFKWADNASMIGLILKLAGFTYGPLLGLFCFGILTHRQVQDRWVPWLALAGPLICLGLDHYQSALLGSYQIGLEMLLLNGALVFGLLWVFSKPGPKEPDTAVQVDSAVHW